MLWSVDTLSMPASFKVSLLWWNTVVELLNAKLSRSPLVGCIVSRNCRNVSGGVKLDAGFFYPFSNRRDGLFAGHYGGRANSKHLQNVRGIAGAKRCNGCCHQFVVAALEGWDDRVIFLTGIEDSGLVIDPFAQSAAQRMPLPLCCTGVTSPADRGKPLNAIKFAR